MKKIMLTVMMAMLFAVAACPQKEEPPPPAPASAPAKPVFKASNPQEQKAAAEINETNATDKAKAMEAELDKDIEAAKSLGQPAAE